MSQHSVTRWAVQHPDGTWLSSRRSTDEGPKVNGRTTTPAYARLFSRPHDARLVGLHPDDKLIPVLVIFPDLEAA